MSLLFFVMKGFPLKILLDTSLDVMGRNSEAHSELHQTSKTELFANIANGLQNASS